MRIVQIIPTFSLGPTEKIRARDHRGRREFGVESARMVIGRSVRNAPGKWGKQTPEIIDHALTSLDGVLWLSIGMPAESGAQRLSRAWPGRFVSLSESANYEHHRTHSSLGYVAAAEYTHARPYLRLRFGSAAETTNLCLHSAWFRDLRLAGVYVAPDNTGILDNSQRDSARRLTTQLLS